MLQDVLTSLRVALGTQNAVFKAAVGTRNEISVTGTVKAGHPCLTRIGTFDVDLLMEGIVLLVRQVGSSPQQLSRMQACLSCSLKCLLVQEDSM